MWFHKAACLLMFAIQLVVPFFLFGAEDIRLIVCGCFIFLQLSIYLTGNFSYLNHLAAVLSLILLNNASLSFATLPAVHEGPEIFLSIAGGSLLALQIMRLWDHFFPNRFFRSILNDLSPLHIANRYGIFAVMTTKRYEVVVEGSDTGDLWKEYDFYHKPTDLKRRPGRISPYQPRLDWQAWFLPFRHFVHEEWFQSFLVHLLKGTPEVLSLIRYNPFKEHPPKFIRATMYIYSFTSFEEKKKMKTWWKRTLVGPYSHTYSLTRH
jgi:hypothetical protein